MAVPSLEWLSFPEARLRPVHVDRPPRPAKALRDFKRLRPDVTAFVERPAANALQHVAHLFDDHHHAVIGRHDRHTGHWLTDGLALVELHQHPAAHRPIALHAVRSVGGAEFDPGLWL